MTTWTCARRKGAIAALAMLAMLILPALLACSAPAARQAPKTAAEPGVLRILNSFTIDSLDPAKPGEQWFPTFGSSELLMQLTEHDELKPWLAESVDRINDTSWRIRLRPGVTFQNGKKVDARAVVACMRRQQEKFPTATALLPGAKIEATGDLELTITTATPDAIVPAKLAEFNGFPIYDAATVEAAGDHPDTLAGKGFYTGPYEPVSFSKTELVLKRYDGYWQGRPALPGVTVRTVLDAQARLAAIQNKEADLSLYPPTETKRTLAGRSDAFFVTAPAGEESLRIEMNQHQAPFNEYAVRRAFGYAIDYKALANEVMDGAYAVATGMLPAGAQGAVPNQTTDLTKATALLEKAGWLPGPDGIRQKGGNRLEVVLYCYPQQPDTASQAVAIQEEVRKAGFDVKIMQSDDITSVLLKPSGWNAALVFNGTISPWSGVPDTSLTRYLSSGSPDNYSGTSDPELDKLISQLSATFDQSERLRLLQRIQRIVIDEKAYLIVASYKRFPMVVGPAYRGYVPSNYRRFVNFDTKPSP